MEVLKKKIEDMTIKWMEDIEKSENSEIVVDLAVVFEKLFCSNIVHICFGEDVSEEIKIEMDFRNKEKSGAEFTCKSVYLGAAINEYDAQVISMLPSKTNNPLYQIARKLTGIKEFTKYQKIVAENGERTRKAINEYIQ